MKNMFKLKIAISLVAITALYCECNQPNKTDNTSTTPVHKHTVVVPKRTAPAKVSYHFEKAKAWVAANGKTLDSVKLHIVLAVNRTDMNNLAKMDSILIPNDLSGDIAFYLPFPLIVPALKDVSKIIFFSYPTQTFATYEYGQLIYTGPTNMGRKKDPTPTGIYYANWKAEETISTVDDEWKLKWNFNIQNKEGIGWHQYSLPGYPASHSCLRLQEGDAHYLYNWADQFIVKTTDGKDSILVNGTPAIVFGTYNFDGPKPWLQVAINPKALDIPATTLEQEVTPHLNEILAQQKKREDADAVIGK